MEAAAGYMCVDQVDLGVPDLACNTPEMITILVQ